jgi:hypothetical protein
MARYRSRRDAELVDVASASLLDQMIGDEAPHTSRAPGHKRVCCHTSALMFVTDSAADFSPRVAIISAPCDASQTWMSGCRPVAEW